MPDQRSSMQIDSDDGIKFDVKTPPRAISPTTEDTTLIEYSILWTDNERIGVLWIAPGQNAAGFLPGGLSGETGQVANERWGKRIYDWNMHTLDSGPIFDGSQFLYDWMELIPGSGAVQLEGPMQGLFGEVRQIVSIM